MRFAETSDPKELLELGFRRLRVGPGGPPAGGSTACVASLNRSSGVLSIANLGDSGALVVRGTEVILESRPQQHDFNYPYQLAIDSGGRMVGASPQIADVYNTTVREGDLVILMTDGILDNLSRPNITKVLELFLEEEDKDPTDIAKALVQLAFAFSRSQTDSPFSLAARAAGFYHPPSGKEDDMTVVVARVEGVASERNKQRRKEGRQEEEESHLDEGREEEEGQAEEGQQHQGPLAEVQPDAPNVRRRARAFVRLRSFQRVQRIWEEK